MNISRRHFGGAAIRLKLCALVLAAWSCQSPALGYVGEERSIAAGWNYQAPFGHLEQLLTRQLSYGILPTLMRYSRNGVSVDGVGVMGSLTYYQKTYEGAFGRIGAGLMVGELNEGNEDSRRGSTSPLALAVVGWQLRSDSGFKAAVFAGGNFLLGASVRETLGFSGIIPAVGIEVGGLQ